MIDGAETRDAPLGDLSPEAFEQYGRQVINWIAGYQERIEEYSVLSQVKPGDIRAALPNHPPTHPEDFDAIFRDFQQIILPGITHWNHPAFFAYFAITASVPGILGELLAAGLNNNSMLWRTSPASTELEEVTLDWLRQMVGLPPEFVGLIYDTASTSSLVAIAAAREATGLEIRTKGLSGRSDLPRLQLYCSDQAHSSIEKAAITLGIGQDNVRKIEVDGAFRLDVAALVGAIEADLATGRRPFCVVATVGTTSTTSVDPVTDIAAVCKTYGLWLHIDAAYGGAAAIVPEMRWVLEGANQADSIVINPHKWLFTPVDISAFFCRHMDVVRSAFALVPEYLRGSDDDQVRNHMDYGPQLGRRFRSLKFWFVLRTYGVEGIIARLREHVRLARELVGWIDDASDWERMAPAPFSTVCFRYHPVGISENQLETLNQTILDHINDGGQALLSHTRLHDILTIRVAIGNINTSERHVREIWNLLQRTAQDIQME